MRTIKYFGIGSFSVAILAMFCGCFLIGLFFTFAFFVLSIVYAINNRSNYKKIAELKSYKYVVTQSDSEISPITQSKLSTMKNFKSYSIATLVASFLFYLVGLKIVVTPLLIASAVCFILYYLFGREKKTNDSNNGQQYNNSNNYAATTWWYMENCDGGDCGGI